MNGPCLWIGAGLACIFASTATAAPDSLEVAVKAAYLYKFAPFVSWPTAQSTRNPATFDICVIGSDPFGSVLDRAVEGQRVDGRAIVIHRLAKAERDSPCLIMYVGGGAGFVRESLRAVAHTPVLTVTDNAATPGIVDFVDAEGRVRFRLDDDAAEAGGLTISSKLLGLALAVKQKSPAKVQS